MSSGGSKFCCFINVTYIDIQCKYGSMLLNAYGVVLGVPKLRGIRYSSLLGMEKSNTDDQNQTPKNAHPLKKAPASFGAARQLSFARFRMQPSPLTKNRLARDDVPLDSSFTTRADLIMVILIRKYIYRIILRSRSLYGLGWLE